MPDGRDAFNLNRLPATRKEDYFVSAANREAFAAATSGSGPAGDNLAIIGPPRSGKSHLGRVWAGEINAVVVCATDVEEILPEVARSRRHVFVDDADRVAGAQRREEALLHLFNLVSGWRGKMAVAALEPPARWKLELPDLASRLETFRVAAIGLPDDDLLRAVIVKLFSDRQVSVAPKAVDYIIKRIDRTFRATEEAVAGLDGLSLAKRRPVTTALVSEWLRLRRGQLDSDGLD